MSPPEPRADKPPRCRCTRRTPRKKVGLASCNRPARLFAMARAGEIPGCPARTWANVESSCGEHPICADASLRPPSRGG
eukprot:15452165-Alexandrium_andersonii.AAC.1